VLKRFSLKPRLHDTICCQTRLTTGCIVYTNIQPVVKLCIMYTAGCQTGCTTRFVEQLLVQHGCQTGLTTGLTAGWMFVYTVQPVVKLVVQPVTTSLTTGCIVKRGIIKIYFTII